MALTIHPSSQSDGPEVSAASVDEEPRASGTEQMATFDLREGNLHLPPVTRPAISR